MATVLASNSTGRSGAMSTPVPSRMRVVAPAIAANAVRGSSHGSDGGYGNRALYG